MGLLKISLNKNIFFFSPKFELENCPSEDVWRVVINVNHYKLF